MEGTEEQPNVAEEEVLVELESEHEVELVVEQVAVKEETKMPVRHLKFSEISERLSMLGKIADGEG